MTKPKVKKEKQKFEIAKNPFFPVPKRIPRDQRWFGPSAGNRRNGNLRQIVIAEIIMNSTTWKMP